MPIVEFDNSADLRYDNWNAIALPVNGDGVCGSGITYELVSPHNGGIEFIRNTKGRYRLEKLSGGCRYFAYDVNRRFILLEWRKSWKSKPSLDTLRESLQTFRKTYRRNVIDNVIFPYWEYKEYGITYEEFLNLLQETLSESGMIIAVVKV